MWIYETSCQSNKIHRSFKLIKHRRPLCVTHPPGLAGGGRGTPDLKWRGWSKDFFGFQKQDSGNFGVWKFGKYCFLWLFLNSDFVFGIKNEPKWNICLGQSRRPDCTKVYQSMIVILSQFVKNVINMFLLGVVLFRCRS